MNELLASLLRLCKGKLWCEFSMLVFIVENCILAEQSAYSSQRKSVTQVPGKQWKNE